MRDLTFLKADDLHEGDEVGITFDVTYGWNRHYKYCKVQKAKVERITPKRTKFIIGGMEFTHREVSKRIVLFNEEAKKNNAMAYKFIKCQNLRFKLDNTKNEYGYTIFHIAKLDDEDLDKVTNLLTYLYDKYIGGNNENS